MNKNEELLSLMGKSLTFDKQMFEIFSRFNTSKKSNKFYLSIWITKVFLPSN